MRLTGLLVGGGLLGYALGANGRRRVAALLIAAPCLAVSLVTVDRRRDGRQDVEGEGTDAIVPVLAHEIRSPLATLRGAVDLLRKGDALQPSRRTEILDIADETTTRLARIVDDAVLAARAGRGDLRVNDERVDLETAVRDVVRAAATDPSSPPITVAAQDGLPLVRGDDIRIRQIATNLLQNAIAHAGPGSTIIVSMVQYGDVIRCTFHNDGAGIAPSDELRLFRPFAASPHRAESMGLGLYIAKRLVEAMGGAISYDTMVGETATFWFTLLASDEHPGSD